MPDPLPETLKGSVYSILPDDSGIALVVVGDLVYYVQCEDITVDFYLA